MNSKKISLLGCVAAFVFAASTATAQMRGHGGSMSRMGMRGPPMSHSMGRMPMQRAPMLNSASSFRRPFFNDRREDRFEARHPFFNDRREDRFEARHPFFNDRREDRFEARRPFFNDRLRSSTIGSRIVLKLGASFPIGSSTTGLTLCSSATSAFHRGGVGALGGVGATRTDTTATTVPVMDTARAVGREWLIYRAGSLAPAITTALSTESWDRRLGERYAPTSATVDT